MTANVMKAFEEYHREKIDGIWACRTRVGLIICVALCLVMVETTINKPIMAGKSVRKIPDIPVVSP